jgi:hypothetical protein
LACWFWRRILKVYRAFLLFYNYLPLKKGYPLRLFKLESPPPKDNLCHAWLKLALWFWGRILNDPTPFLHFCDHLPFEEDLALY